jgi:hypothetical protein
MELTWESVRGHTDSVEVCAALDEEFYNLDVALDGSHMQGSSVIVAYGQDVNGGDLEIAQRHTDSVDIHAALNEEFHNLDMAVDGSQMQGSQVVVVYGRDVNGGDSETGPETHQ